MKKCPEGEYYCNDMKKCRPIPKGYHTARGGFLVRDTEKKNGNGNGNGHSSNGNGNGNGGNGNGNGGNGGGLGESMKRLPLKIEIPKTSAQFNLGLMFRENLDSDSGMLFIFDEVGEKSFHMRHTTIPLDIAFISEEGVIESIKELEPLRSSPVYSDANVMFALEVNRGWFAENNVKVGDKIVKLQESDCECEDCGQDPCVECGESHHNIDEDTSFKNELSGVSYEFIDIIKPEPMKVPKHRFSYIDTSDDISAALPSVQEATRLPNYNKVGNIIDVYLAWRGKNYMIKMFFPSVKKPSRREVQDQVRKVYPNAKLWNYQVSEHEPGEPLLQTTGGA